LSNREYRFPGAKELFDLLERRKAEVEAVIRTRRSHNKNNFARILKGRGTMH
jgi:hypothetical protein